MMMKATDVLTMMDEAGARGTDYLFGLDFELDEGFFVEHPLEQSELLFGIGRLTNCTEEADRSKRPELRILSTDREGLRPRICHRQARPGAGRHLPAEPHGAHRDSHQPDAEGNLPA